MGELLPPMRIIRVRLVAPRSRPVKRVLAVKYSRLSPRRAETSHESFARMLLRATLPFILMPFNPRATAVAGSAMGRRAAVTDVLAVGRRSLRP